MQVILLEKIRNLGDLGDKVTVKPGYGRNYLIPYNKAVFATERNIKNFEKKRAELEKKAQEAFAQAEKRAQKISTAKVVISAQASEEGKLYGSVGISEIKKALDAQDIEVGKREISLPQGSFYSVGEYVVEIRLHSDVAVDLNIEIVSSK